MSNNLERYYHYRDLIRPGDPITWVGSGPISWGIRLWSDRSHASSALGEVQAGVMRRLIIEADQGEVNTRLLSQKLKGYKGRCYLHKLKPDLEEFRPAIVNFLWAHLGIEYDFMSLFGNMISRVSTNGAQFFCSELTGASVWYPPEKKEKKKFLADPGIPRKILEKYLPNKWLELLLSGKALRPGGIAKLPLYEAEIQLL